MNTSSVLQRLFGLAGRGMRLGLDRVREAKKRLGDPGDRLRCVQIAGTNGKGTVSYLVASAATESGLKAGLFTSPHLHRFAERIRIDGAEISGNALCLQLGRVFDVLDAHPDLDLTFFEVTTLAALLAFDEARVDIAVLEVGLGGRLDATTIAPAEITAVTSVGLDHTSVLGSTLTDIAREKAGIARPGVPMVIGPVASEALLAVQEAALRAGSPVVVFGKDFSVEPDMVPPWPGLHQRQNTAVACKVFELFSKGDPMMGRDSFRHALSLAKWPGRFEVVRTPTTVFILDGAHNLEGASALAQSLTEFPLKPDVLVFGALADKPALRMLEVLRPSVKKVVLVPPPLSRAVDVREIAAPGDAIASTAADALQRAGDLSVKGLSVLVSGSLFLVAEARALLLGEPSDPHVRL